MKKHIVIIIAFTCFICNFSLFPSQTAEEYFDQGNEYSEQEKYEDAINYYTKAIELDPEYEAAYFNRGRLYFSYLEDYEKSLSDISVLITLNPNNAHYFNIRAINYAELGDHEEAIDDYTKAIELDPDYKDAYLNRAITFLDIKRYKDAVKDCTKVLTIESNNISAYNLLGAIYFQMGKYRKAVWEFSKIITITKDFEYAYQNRARAYIQLGQEKQALEDIKKAEQIKTPPLDFTRYKAIGALYVLTGKYEKAIGFLDKSIEMEPGNINSYFIKLYASGKISQEAYYKMLKTIEVQKNMSTDDWEIAIADFLLQNISKEELLEKANRDSEKLFEANFYIGVHYLNHNNSKQAKYYFKLVQQSKKWSFIEYDFSTVELRKSPK